jgi:hypothetical protein
VYRYYTEEAQKQEHATAQRRLTAMQLRLAELRKQYQPSTLPPRTNEVLRRYHGALCRQITGDLAAAEQLIAALAKDLADHKRITARLDQPERLLSHLGIYVAAARAYPAYSSQFGQHGVVTFTLEPTQSYAILPGGPQGHNDELSHYSWGDERGFENPQLLPGSEVVPAAPSRTLSTFGCPGTFVPLSFALVASQNQRDVRIDCSHLVYGASTLPREAIDVRVVAPWFRPMAGKPRLLNEMLLHDPEFVIPVPEKKQNRYKDPNFGSDAPSLQPLTVPAGTLRQFVVTIKLPDKLPPGLYRGTLRVKAASHEPIVLRQEVEVLPFQLEPTAYAFSAYYRAHLRDEAEIRKQRVHPTEIYKTTSQMQAELVNMAEHGFNTLNLYEGYPKRQPAGWDFSALGRRLEMARSAGLTRSPFLWLAHGQHFVPSPLSPDGPRTVDEVRSTLRSFVAAVRGYCDRNAYPRPALYGHDEASGEELKKLQPGYAAVREADGLVAVACYPSYFDEIGGALGLPIVMGGGQTAKGRSALAASRRLGFEGWVYNSPATNSPAAPSVYRRRYGLALMRNGETGACPWEYQGVCQRGGSPDRFNNVFTEPLYALAYPSWQGRPIDTLVFEAFREGIYDSRYLATLEKALHRALTMGKSGELTGRVERWLATFSVNDDLQRVRRQMADFIVELRAAGP